MKRNDPVKNLMATDVETIRVDDKLSKVRKILSEGNIHHLPVVSGTKLVGILSATDMVRLSFSAYGADERAVDALLDHDFSVEKVMQKDVITINAKGTVRDAAQQLSAGSFHSLPIVDDEGNLAGLVTSTDLIRYLLDQY